MAILQLDHDGIEGIGIPEVVHFVERYGRMIGLATTVVVGMAAIYILFAEPMYTARAQLLIDPQMPQPLRDRSFEQNLSLDSSQVESQIAVLRSEKIAEMVVKQLDLYTDAELTGRSTPDYVSTRKVIEHVGRNLDVRRSGPSYAIDISYSSRDPEKAAKVANAMAEAYINEQLTVRAQVARQGSEWLDARLDQLRRQMNSSALKVQEFKAKRDYRLVQRPETGGTGSGRDGGPTTVEQATLDELESTAGTYRRIYESYLQAYTESVQRQSFPVSNARVITAATRPLVKSSPKTLLILALGALLGLLLGACASVLHATMWRYIGRGVTLPTWLFPPEHRE